MRELWDQMMKCLLNGGNAALSTVVHAQGSTPRGAGARMLCDRRGRVCGTVGGGVVEYQCIRQSAEALAKGIPQLQTYELDASAGGADMVCGGRVQVVIQPYGCNDAPRLTPALNALLEMDKAGEECFLAQDITPGGEGGFSAIDAGGHVTGAKLPDEVVAQRAARPVCVQAQGRVYFLERLVRPGRVYIFGGGHVAQALTPVLAGVDFRCVVLESRREFLDASLFPGAEEVREADFSNLASAVQITADDYVCVMSRGHKDDLIIQAQVLRTPARYIGVIGSAAKAADAAAKLKAMGFAESEIARILTPIGLNIASETPAEIAISIAAQLIRVRAGGSAR